MNPDPTSLSSSSSPPPPPPPFIRCLVHLGIAGTEPLNVPCAPGGKVWVCEECAKPENRKAVFEAYQAGNASRILAFKSQKAVPLTQECFELISRFRALVVLGVPVRVRANGLERLADLPSPLTARILTKCLEVLEGKWGPERRYWPLLDLVVTERGVAEQCFPDAPATAPEGMRVVPGWLLRSPIIEPRV